MITSEYQLEKLLIDVGRKLIVPPYYVGELRFLLNKLVYNLSKVEPFPSQFMQDALGPSMIALISPRLLRHPNIDVRVSVASCLCEILRITAPNSSYSDEQMREVFQVIVATFGTLLPEYKYYYTSFAILHKVARAKLCLLNLGCDELFIEMFQYFLTVAQFHCPDNMFANMEEIMTMVLQESNDISRELLYPLLDSVRKDDGNVGSLSWQLGEQVLMNCAEKLKPYLMEAVQSLGSVLDDYAPIVTSICKYRACVNLVEATPMDYSPWESIMKLIQDMSAKLDAQPQSDLANEPEPMPQGVVSFPNPMPTKDNLEEDIEVVTKVDHLCAEFVSTVEHWCTADASSFEIQEGIVAKDESLAPRIVSEFAHGTKDLVMDLAPIADNLGVEEIVVQESHPEKTNLSEFIACPSGLLEVQIIDFLGVENFELTCDRYLLEFFAKLKILLRVAQFEVELTQRLKQLAYSKYLFIWNGRIQYLHPNSNSRSSFSHPGRVDGDSMHVVQPDGPIRLINLKTKALAYLF